MGWKVHRLLFYLTVVEKGRAPPLLSNTNVTSRNEKTMTSGFRFISSL